MKQQIKKLILSRIVLAKKTPQDVSTYSLVRPGNGFFYLKVYWKGKAKKGMTTAILIDITYKIEDAFSAMYAVEEIMEEAKNITLNMDQPLNVEKQKDINAGYGGS